MGINLSSEAKTQDYTAKLRDNKKLSLQDSISIEIVANGFSPISLTVFSGQAICWEWDAEDIDVEHNVKQVTFSDHHVPVPVPNGLCSGQVCNSGSYEVNLNTPGTYHFISDGHSCVRVGTIKVVECPSEVIKVFDQKFTPEFVEISQGDSVTWKWETTKGNLNRLEYCQQHSGIVSTTSNSSENGNSCGSHTECFLDPGMYYFTEDYRNVCVVKVVQRAREVSVVFEDSGAQPSWTNAHVGDRIWVKNLTSKQNDGVMMIKTEDGGILVSSRVSSSKRNVRRPNLLSYCFAFPGIYRITCTVGFTSLCSIILVKPKPNDYVININHQGFCTELGSMRQGDRIWWVWSEDKKETPGFLIDEIERRLLDGSTQGNEEPCQCFQNSDVISAIARVGVMSSVAKKPGLFTYQVKEIGDWKLPLDSLCSIIVQSVCKDHVVQVTDHSFHPQIVNVYPGDSVTWIWRDTIKSHNIQQVSHGRLEMDDGFHSACVSRSPDAFNHVFTDLGVFYFTSSNLCGAYGAVVVTSGKQVHKVEVTLHGVEPDPLGVRVGDLVCWRWNSGQLYSINAIQTPEEIDNIVKKQEIPRQRRCVARSFSRPGVHHVVATAYLQDEDGTLQPCDSFINTIYVDHASYTCRMRISRDGFQPHSVVLAKHDSILWYWDNPEEKHNVLLVENPKGRARPIAVHGSSFFESGPVITCSSFFHTFDTPGSYWVTSHGTEGKVCRVDVLQEAKRLLSPAIVGEQDGGNVEQGYKVCLWCDDPEVQILYTTDGTQPGEQNPSTKVYDNQDGLVLSRPGLFLIRALSMKSGWINSRTFTSRRFWVFSEENDEGEDEESHDNLRLKEEISKWQWISCVPCISFFFVHENVIQIDITPSKIADLSLVTGYQLYINGFPYGDLLGARCPGVVVSGLTGCRMYHMAFVVFPNTEDIRPQLSNEITINCPALSSFGGPLVSLETCNRVNAVVIVWAANHRCQYTVLINGQPMGEKFYPEPDAPYCHVLFETECTKENEQTFIICVEMNQEGEQPMCSNEIQLSFPLPEEIVSTSTKQPTMSPHQDKDDDNNDDIYNDRYIRHDGSPFNTLESGIHNNQNKRRTTYMNDIDHTDEDPKNCPDSIPREPSELLIVSELPLVEKDPVSSGETRPFNFQSSLGTIHEDKQLDIVPIIEESLPQNSELQSTGLKQESGDNQLKSLDEQDGIAVIEEHLNDNGEPCLNCANSEHGEQDGESTSEEPFDDDGQRGFTGAEELIDSLVEQDGISNIERDHDEESDVTGGEPDVTSEEPDVTGEERDVTNEEPDVTSEEADVTGEESYVTDEEPDVTSEDPNIYGEEPNFMDKKNDVIGEEPNVTGEDPVVTGEEPDVTGEEQKHNEKRKMKEDKLATDEHLNIGGEPGKQNTVINSNDDKMSDNDQAGEKNDEENLENRGVRNKDLIHSEIENDGTKKVLYDEQEKEMNSNNDYYTKDVQPQKHADVEIVENKDETSIIDDDLGNSKQEHSTSNSDFDVYYGKERTTRDTDSDRGNVSGIYLDNNKQQEETDDEDDADGVIEQKEASYDSNRGEDQHRALEADALASCTKQENIVNGVRCKDNGYVQEYSVVETHRGGSKKEDSTLYNGDSDRSNNPDTIDSNKDIQNDEIDSNTKEVTTTDTGGSSPLLTLQGDVISPEMESSVDVSEEFCSHVVAREIKVQTPCTVVRKEDDKVKIDKEEEGLDKVEDEQETQEMEDIVENKEEDETAEVYPGETRTEIHKRDMCVNKNDVKDQEEVSDGSTGNLGFNCQLSNDLKLAVKGVTADKVVLEWEDGTSITSSEYCVMVFGEKFNADVDSYIRYDLDSSPTPELWPNDKSSIEQHCWTTDQSVIQIHGLKTKKRYSIAVLARSRDVPNMAMTSDVAVITMPGRPKAPVIKILSLKDQEFTICWRTPCSYGDAEIVGYKLLVNGSQHGDLLPPESTQMMVVNQEYGTFQHVSLIAVTGHVIGDSTPSNVVTVACPHPPPPPKIVECASPSPNAISISWTPVSMTTAVNQLKLLSSYDVFVDDVLHGSCPVGDVNDVFQETCIYTIPECIAGRKYSVYVRGHVDPQTINSSPPAHMCGCYGDTSNILQVSCAKEPHVPELVVDHIDETKVDLSWNNESSDSAPYGIKGYLLRIDGRIHGDILDPDDTSVTISNLSLGSDVNVSLTPLHDQDRINQLQIGLNRQNEGQDSGVESSSSFGLERRIASRVLGPSSSLVLHLWGLVRKVDYVRVMDVTCCSVEVRWNVLESESTFEGQLHPVYVDPKEYRVKLFKSKELEELEILTYETRDMNIKLTDLSPSCRYAVTVEALADHLNYIKGTSNWNISKSQKVWFDTKNPPYPPENIKVVYSTLNSICLSWDPLNTGDTLKFLSLDVYKMDDSDERGLHNALLNFVINPHMSSYTIHSLDSKTRYIFRFRTTYGLTDDQKHSCSTDSSIKAWTSGVDRPRDLHVTNRTLFSLHVSWQPAISYGDIKVLYYLVHYTEKKLKPLHGSNVEVNTLRVPQGTAMGPQCEIRGLGPGVKYIVTVEAVISHEENDQERREDDQNDDDETVSSTVSSESDWLSQAAEDCRSKSVIVSTLAPPCKPELFVTGMSATQIHLAWNKPCALELGAENQHHASDQELCGRIRKVSGYTVEVNGRVIARLSPNKHNFTMTKCKLGMKYKCYLVVMTSMDGADGKDKKNEVRNSKVISRTDEVTDSEDEETDSYQEARSDALEVIIPRHDPPLVLNVYYNPTSAHVSTTSSAGSDEPDEGCVVLEWKSNTPLKGVASYKVMWMGTLDGQDENEDTLKPSCRRYVICPVKQRSVYSIWLKMVHKEGPAISYGPFHCQVPGRPASPWIWCKSVSPYRIHLEWNESRTYGIDTIRAYQINLNGRQLGKLLSPQSRKAAVHCQPNSIYRITLMALTTDPHLGDADPSNVLTVCTPGATEKSLDPKQNMRLRPLWAENDSLTVEWSDENDLLTVDHYVIKWSSVLQPQSREAVISMEETSFRIEDCQPGIRHFIAVAAVDNRGKLVSKSQQLIMQTSAPLAAPQLRPVIAIPSSIIFEWDEPQAIGDATVVSYEIKVDEVVVIKIDNIDDRSFEWQGGSPCQKYNFQIKALSCKNDCHSEWSQVLQVVCPGASQPVLSRAPTSYVNSVHVTWDTPTLFGGARVEYYKVHYLASDDEIPLDSILGNHDAIIHGPLQDGIHNDTLNNVLPSLPYWVVLEVRLNPEGCHTVFSRPIRARAAAPPEPPIVNVNVIGLKERKTLERFISRLTQLKDRICRKVNLLQNTVVVKGSKQKEIQITKNLATIHNLDIELTHGLQYIRTLTGTLTAELSWSVPRDDGDAMITGYQVLIDGKIHEQPLDMYTLEYNLELPASSRDQVLSLKSLTNHPIGHSAPSREIILPTKDFLPFVQFCYFGAHSESGDCCYEESLSFEITNKQTTTHRGSLGQPLPSPVCNVVDIVGSCIRPLIEATDKPQVILFWTVWCRSSIKAMKMFLEFSLCHRDKMEFKTCCVQSSQTISDHHKYLLEQLTSREWITSNIQHLCACHPTGQRSILRRNEGGGSKISVCHMYGVVGVPTIVLCNQEGYMVWQGRVCAHDYSECEQFLLHALNESLDQDCNITECKQCQLDHELDTTGHVSQILPEPHEYYNYKNAKQDPSLVVTGRLSRSREKESYGHSSLSDENFSSCRKVETNITENVCPEILENTDSLRRRLHDGRPQTSPSKDCSSSLRRSPKPHRTNHVRFLTEGRAKTASHARNSVFKDRFSSSMTSSLPSLGLTNQNPESKLDQNCRVKRKISKKRKVTISVEEFSPV